MQTRVMASGASKKWQANKSRRRGLAKSARISFGAHSAVTDKRFPQGVFVTPFDRVSCDHIFASVNIVIG
jgi:hypothetical protein